MTDTERLEAIARYGWHLLICEDRTIVLSVTSRPVAAAPTLREAIDEAIGANIG